MADEIINTYDQLRAAATSGFDKRQAVAVSYSAPDRSNSRDVSVPKWSVWSPFFKTYPDAPWYDNDSRTFSLSMNSGTYKERKDAALDKATTWAAEQYGITHWAKNRQGDYVPKEVNDRFPIRKNK